MMDNQRLILFVALALVVILMWDAWNQKFSPTAPTVATSQTGPAASTGSVPAPATAAKDTPPVVATVADAPAPDKPQAGSQTGLATQQRIRVITDVLDVDIDTAGGDLRRAFLRQFPTSPDKANEPYPLMNDSLPQLFVAQTGLLSNKVAPDHHALYAAEKTEYTLADGEKELKVPLTWVSPEGITVTKVYTFRRNDYLINVDHVVKNDSAEEWRGRLYRQFQRTEYDEAGKSRMLYTFTGGAVSTPEKPYEKIELQDMAEWKPAHSYSTGGWVAMLQHYFVTAWIPGPKEVNHLFTRVLGDGRYILGMTGDETAVAPGATQNFLTGLYVGPKDQQRLQAVEPNLILTVDYGVLTVIADPLFWSLKQIYNVVGNWGWAIVAVTFFLKLLFYPLSAASYRSMANMKKLTPKFQSIRERYADDRQRMSQAMMELYKTEKVNPFSGCWPMLVQIPVFLALYWTLLESVELRQADWILWITDLSAKDPYYVLPLLMGATMFIQQKLSANPGLDPMQQKIMQWMPVIFTAFFMLFPAGLVLYWVVNNTLSIAQQAYITRKIEAAAKA